MIKSSIKILLLFSSVIINISCESVVDVVLPNDKPLIVVNSFFTPDSIFKVHLSKSLQILSNEDKITGEYGFSEIVIPVIENAKVELWNDENFITNLIYNKDGYYIAPRFYPEQNKNYKIIVNAEGYNSVSASDIVPEMIPIKEIKINKISIEQYDEKKTELTVNFIDKPDIENFYELYITYISDDHNYFHLINFESDDILFGGNGIIDEINGGINQTTSALFDDSIFSGKEYNIKLSFYVYDLNNIYFVLSSISKDKYLYLKSIKEQRKFKDNPFSEPVFIHNNVKNGLGIFAGYSSTIYKIE